MNILFLLLLTHYCYINNKMSCIRKAFLFLSWALYWRRKWQPTPVFLPGELHGQRSLMGYSPWGQKELDMTNTKSLSHVQLLCDPMDCTWQALLPMKFSRQECWRWLSCSSPGDLPNPKIKPMFSTCQAYSLPLSHLGSPERYNTPVAFLDPAI